MIVIIVLALIAVGLAAWNNPQFAEFFHVTQAQSIVILGTVLLIFAVISFYYYLYLPSALKSAREGQVGCLAIGAVSLIGPNVLMSIASVSVPPYVELKAYEPGWVTTVCALGALALSLVFQKRYSDLSRPSRRQWASESHTFRGMRGK